MKYCFVLIKISKFVVIRKNENDLGETIKFAIKIGATNVGLTRINRAKERSATPI